MSIKVSALLRQEAETEIKFFDEKGIVKFRPGAITDDMFERVQAAAEADDENVLNKLIAEVLISWDVVDEKGEMVPFTQEVKGEKGEKLVVASDGIKGIPIPFKAAVLEQVIEAARGNSRPSSETSRAGSRRTRR